MAVELCIAEQTWEFLNCFFIFCLVFLVFDSQIMQPPVWLQWLGLGLGSACWADMTTSSSIKHCKCIIATFVSSMHLTTMCHYLLYSGPFNNSIVVVVTNCSGSSCSLLFPYNKVNQIKWCINSGTKLNQTWTSLNLLHFQWVKSYFTFSSLNIKCIARNENWIYFSF